MRRQSSAEVGTAAELVDAPVPGVPAVPGFEALLEHAVAHGGSCHVEVLCELVGVLHLEGAHQLVVLVLQEVAVVDIARVLNELVLGDGEVGVAALPVEEVVGRGEPDPHHHHRPVGDQPHLLPSPVLLGHQLVGDRPANVLVLVDAVGLAVVLELVSLGLDELEDVET